MTATCAIRSSPAAAEEGIEAVRFAGGVDRQSLDFHALALTSATGTWSRSSLTHDALDDQHERQVTKAKNSSMS